MWGPLGRVTATRGFGKPCYLLTDVNHLVKVIIPVNLAVWQVCRFPHYRLHVSMRGGNKKSYEHLGEGATRVYQRTFSVTQNDKGPKLAHS